MVWETMQLKKIILLKSENNCGHCLEKKNNLSCLIALAVMKDAFVTPGSWAADVKAGRLV